jgi:hypothetical protein
MSSEDSAEVYKLACYREKVGDGILDERQHNSRTSAFQVQVQIQVQIQARVQSKSPVEYTSPGGAILVERDQESMTGQEVLGYLGPR